MWERAGKVLETIQPYIKNLQIYKYTKKPEVFRHHHNVIFCKTAFTQVFQALVFQSCHLWLVVQSHCAVRELWSHPMCGTKETRDTWIYVVKRYPVGVKVWCHFCPGETAAEVWVQLWCWCFKCLWNPSSSVRGLDMLSVRSEKAQSFYFDKEKVGMLFYRGLRVATQWHFLIQDDNLI